MSSTRLPALLLVPAVLVGLLFACGDDPAGGGPGDPVPEGGADGPSPPQRAEFGLDARPPNPTCKAPARPPSTAPVSFQRVYQNVQLAAPMMMAQIPGDGSRWFVALRDGRIVSFSSTAPANTPTEVANVATLSGMPVQGQSEGGLLGLAFHPSFAQNGKLYVTWVTTGGGTNFRSLVGVLTSTNNGTSFTSYETILGPFDQPAGNHNGGGIAFGKDGFLYLSFGDGGGGGDSFLKGQKKDEFFSKILRIDVDNPAGAQKYGIPDGNPFKGGGGEPATFAYGFRNPFRFSVDRETGEVWAADVGQNKWEEVDQVKLGGNYGWPCYEGTHEYDLSAQRCPDPTGLLDPVVEHEHVPNNSRSITGGVVYRGKAIPGFVGSYVYGDYEKLEHWALSFDPTTGEPKTQLLNEQGPNANWVHFAEDQDGEVYAVALNQGSIHKLVPAQGGGGASTFPDRLSKTGCVDPADPKRPASGLVPFGINAPLWSDGAAKERWLALPDGATITVKDDGDFDFPSGTVLVKTFLLGGKRIETRLFVRHDDGVWAGYTYEWLDDESDAVLLPSSKTKKIGAQDWYYPSRSDCVRCHSEAAGRSLGPELGQLNGDLVYPSTNRISNQLKTLEHIGMFSAPLGKPVEQIVAFPDPLGTGPLEARARAYMHSNCASCHRPQGPAGGDLDLRFATTLGATKACGIDPQRGDLGVAGAKLLAPGDPAKSMLAVRTRASGANRMPPLASSVVDEQGAKVLEDWIRSITACPGQ